MGWVGCFNMMKLQLLRRMIVLIFATFIFFIILPGLFLYFSFRFNNFDEKYIKTNLEYTTDLSGFGTLPNIEFREEQLCGDAIYLGSDDVYQNCSEKCNSGNYEYSFIGAQGGSIVLNGKKLRGAYCLLKSIAKCNLNTSTVYIGDDGYKCLSNFPELLGGESGNLIIGCNGTLKDGLYGIEYLHNIPNNLKISSLDERLENGSYRFTCGGNDNVEFPKTLGSRFDISENICNKLDPNGRVDREHFVCSCDRYMNDDQLKICSTCKTGYASSVDIEGAKYGYTLGRDCVPLSEYGSLSKYVKFPCGPTTSLKNEKCEHALLLASASYSPPRLQKMFG